MKTRTNLQGRIHCALFGRREYLANKSTEIYCGGGNVRNRPLVAGLCGEGRWHASRRTDGQGYR